MDYNLKKLANFFQVPSKSHRKNAENVLWFVLSWRNHFILSSWCSKSNFMFEQRSFVIYLLYFDQNTAKSVWQCPFKFTNLSLPAWVCRVIRLSCLLLHPQGPRQVLKSIWIIYSHFTLTKAAENLGGYFSMESTSILQRNIHEKYWWNMGMVTRYPRMWIYSVWLRWKQRCFLSSSGILLCFFHSK